MSFLYTRAKKRINQTLVPVPADLNPTNDPLMAVTLRRNMFFTELKDSNNRYTYNRAFHFRSMFKATNCKKIYGHL